MRKQQLEPLCIQNGHVFDDAIDGPRCIYCGRKAIGYGFVCYSCGMSFNATERKEMYLHKAVCPAQDHDESFSLFRIVPYIEKEPTNVD